MTMPTKAGLRFLLKQVIPDPQGIPNDLVESLAHERNRKGNKQSMLRILRSGINIRGIHSHLIDLLRLEYLNVPTYVLWGRDDKIFPYSHGKNAAMRLPRGRLTVLDDCGHWPQIEKHKEFNRLVVEFLR
jgi:pimeloyl-ACP methyl ester carboxylesterase